jgi:riboflavin kinase
MMKHNSDIFNLPDLLFVQFCNETYGVNRGVFNTIDTWLYQRGVINILNRRKVIFEFLEWFKAGSEEKHGKIKIGHGNLSHKLKLFFESPHIKRNLIS